MMTDNVFLGRSLVELKADNIDGGSLIEAINDELEAVIASFSDGCDYDKKVRTIKVSIMLKEADDNDAVLVGYSINHSLPPKKSQVKLGEISDGKILVDQAKQTMLADFSDKKEEVQS